MRAIPLIGCLAALLALASPAHCEDKAPRPAAEVDADLLALIGNQAIENFIAKVLAPIRQAREPGRLTRQEVADRETSERAVRRASQLVEILRLDLDGDGIVVRAEAEQAYASGRTLRNRAVRNVGADAVGLLFEADANADGRIDIPEMLAWANGKGAASAGGGSLEQILLELDADGDGATTIVEAETRARQVFARYDLDGDGIIDQANRPAISKVTRERKRADRVEREAERCGMPPAPAGARILMFSTGTAQAVSSVAIDGPTEATLTTAVTVEPGDEKLYLVLAAQTNMLWRFEGAVDRLAHVVLLEGKNDPYTTASALTGVDRSLVSWAPEENCAVLRGTGAEKRTAEIFTAIHGRPADAFEKVYSIGSVSVPSLKTIGGVQQPGLPVRKTACRAALGQGGTVFSPQAAEGEETAPCDWIRAESELLFPGGVVDIDPASVVGRRPAVRYEVLPSPFGFRDALANGTLVNLSEGRNIRFRIAKPLAYLPPVASWPRWMDFELAEGIEPPLGDRRRVCIFDPGGTLLPGEAATRCAARSKP